MTEVPFLSELALVTLISVLVTLVLARLQLPAVAGLLAAGALGGPFGLGLVHSSQTIEVLAEVGVVLLLFTIGLEFSVARLSHIFRRVALGGLLQVALTAAVVTMAALALGQPVRTGVFYGFVFALSSTAIVLRALSERRELDAPHGRFIVGTLIFQDLCVIPMVLVVPMLKESVDPTALAWGVGRALAEAAVVMAAVLGVARFLVPRVLSLVVASRSREVFLLAVLGLCVGTAWLTSQAGLSLALGAFLGGMVVADTEYGHRAMGDILPLRDVFVSLFFVSLGMLFDVQVVRERPATVGVLFLGFVLLKGVLATVAALVMRFPSRAAWLAGVGLAQFGEFGFVLARLGESSGVVGPDTTRPMLCAGIASMFVTPLLVRAAPHVRAGERLLAPLERLLGVGPTLGHPEPHHDRGPLTGHVVLVGFGVAGRLAAQALRACDVRYVVLEVNAETVRKARAQGLPVHYADATSPEALERVDLPHASALVLLMNDPSAARRVLDTAHRLAPEVPVLMRTHYLADRAELLGGGAHDVVAEEVESAVEVLSRMLRWLEVPRNVIDARVHDARAATQTSERSLKLPRHTWREHRGLDELKVESVRVETTSPAAGKSAVELELRTRTGALLVAVRRGDRLIDQPDPGARFEPGDIAYLVGSSEAVERAVALLGPRAS